MKTCFDSPPKHCAEKWANTADSSRKYKKARASSFFQPFFFLVPRGWKMGTKNAAALFLPCNFVWSILCPCATHRVGALPVIYWRVVRTELSGATYRQQLFLFARLFPLLRKRTNILRSLLYSWISLWRTFSVVYDAFAISVPSLFAWPI